MPLPGGPADKAGNRYELAWTALNLARILRGEADRACLEPIGPEGEGVEFWIEASDRREYHQVKRQQSGKGHWSIRSLDRVLRSFGAKLPQDPGAICVFASTEAADGLRELVELALAAPSSSEFDAAVRSGDSRARNFGSLKDAWGSLDIDTLQSRLRRVEVRTLDERSLIEKVRFLLEPLVTGEASAAADVLSQLGLEGVHQQWEQEQLWKRLSDRGFARRDWSRHSNAESMLRQRTRTYVETAGRSPIAQISRIEASEILALLTQAGSNAPVLLTGDAGAGKSSVIAQVVEGLEHADAVVLAFRVDNLRPTPSTRELGQQLDLDASPATVLAGVAAGRPAVLVIDQLDAVSVASGRDLHMLFDVLNEVIGQTRVHPNISVLMACRSFDIHHDSRLRALAGAAGRQRTFQLDRLAASDVERALSAHGVETAELPEDLRQLLALPLHLALFARLIRAGTRDAFESRSALDLLDCFWNHQRQQFALRPSRHAWEAAVRRLAEAMSDRRALSIPLAAVDDIRDEIDLLASQHIVVVDRGAVSFFHESFFDYAFVRTCSHSTRVRDLLERSDQELFRRAQVRQFLAYLRDRDFETYLTDLRYLLTSPQVRSHIRTLVVDTLARLPAPRLEEWQMLEPLMDSEHPDLAKGPRHVVGAGNPAWIHLVDRCDALDRWLSSPDDQLVDFAVAALAYAADRCAELAAEKLPLLVVDERWSQRVLGVLFRAGAAAATPSLFRYFMAQLSAGLFDDRLEDMRAGEGLSVWLVLRGLSDQYPAQAAEGIAATVRRLASQQPSRYQLNSVTRSDGYLISKCVQREPLAFARAILPLVAELVDRFAIRDDRTPHRDKVWHDGDLRYAHGLADELLSGLAQALRAVAVSSPGDFRTLASALTASDCRTLHALLLHACSSLHPDLGDEVGASILEHWRTYGIWYSEGLLWAARAALAQASKTASEDTVRGLESLILQHRSAWEHSRAGFRSRGLRAFILLGGMPDARLSGDGRLRFFELRRKFEKCNVEAPSPRGGEYVSPVPPEAAPRMSDEQWRQAIRDYATDDPTRSEHDRVIGGARQLAQLLGDTTKSDPARFARLCLTLSHAETHPAYVQQILWSIPASSLPTPLVADLCEFAHSIPGRPCGREIAHLLRAHAANALPSETLEILSWYAVEDADPTQDPENADFCSRGINSARGAVAETIGALIAEDPAREPEFASAIRSLVSDRTLSVRSCAAVLCLAVLGHDRDRAVSLFRRLTDTGEALLAARCVERFMWYGLSTHFAELQPVIDRMLASSIEEVAATGSRVACAAALLHDSAVSYAEQCLSGTTPLRRAAARVFATNCGDADLRAFCQHALLQLFADSEDEVRRAASQCFRNIDARDAPAWSDLAAAFVDSDAFADGADSFFDFLDSLPELPRATAIRAAERAAEMDGPHRFSSEAGEIAVRVYHQAGAGELRHRALDVIDRLSSARAYGIDKALQESER